MRSIIFGDGLWAAKCLQRLVDDGHTIPTIVMRRKPTNDSLAAMAARLGVKVCAPSHVNDQEFVRWIRAMEPDLNISISYDQILRRPLIEAAQSGFINVHAGKLPKYRGRNVINWAIINNEREIGLTVHYMDEGIDTGDIILQRTLPIYSDDTYHTTLLKVQDAFPDILADALQLIQDAPAHRRPQHHEEATYFSGRVIGDEWIDWNDISLNVYNKVRAIGHPGPGARTLLGDRTLIIWRASYDPKSPKYAATPGEVVGVISDRGVTVKTGDSTVLLELVQYECDSQDKRVPNFKIGTRFGVNITQEIQRLRSQVKELNEIVGARQMQVASPLCIDQESNPK